MGATKVHSSELYPRLNRVFRNYGFEGATMSRISSATGLGRASLYHRFPGGKSNMVDALLGYVEETCMRNMLAPLKEPGPRREKVAAMAVLIDEFYEGGHCACLFETLSLGDANQPFRPVVKQLFENWVQAMASVAVDAGFSPAEAQRRGEQALVGIQGALVFARASGDDGPFRRVIEGLPDLLLGTPGESSN